MDENWLDETIARYAAPEGQLLGILSAVQERERHIPKEAIIRISEKLGVPRSQLYSLVTFYSFFSLQPVGDHVVTVCMGTACHVKGAEAVLAALGDLLGLEVAAADEGKFSATTEDNKFTVSIARCFGACSMAPVVQVDGKLYGYATAENLPAILAEYGWRENDR